MIRRSVGDDVGIDDTDVFRISQRKEIFTAWDNFLHEIVLSDFSGSDELILFEIVEKAFSVSPSTR